MRRAMVPKSQLVFSSIQLFVGQQICKPGRRSLKSSVEQPRKLSGLVVGSSPTQPKFLFLTVQPLKPLTKPALASLMSGSRQRRDCSRRLRSAYRSRNSCQSRQSGKNRRPDHCQAEGDWWGLPLLQSQRQPVFRRQKDDVSPYWPLGTAVIKGPKVLVYRQLAHFNHAAAIRSAS
jgi:hypothetical protein